MRPSFLVLKNRVYQIGGFRSAARADGEAGAFGEFGLIFVEGEKHFRVELERDRDLQNIQGSAAECPGVEPARGGLPARKCFEESACGSARPSRGRREMRAWMRPLRERSRAFEMHELRML